MNIHAGLQCLLLAGVVGLNIQISMVSGLGAPRSEALAPAPAISQEHQAEMDRLRTENATLQVIVKHASFNNVVDTVAPVSTASVGVPMPAIAGWPNLPPFPDLPVVSAAPTAGQAKAPAAADTTKSPSPQKAPVVFRPIRLKEDGGLLYLAADGNIRVVRSGGQLYGMNGRYIESDGRQAVFELAGRKVPLPLIGE